MDANDELKQMVIEELRADPRLAQQFIDVQIDDGVVTLRGEVDRHPARQAAARAAERVCGVRAVANHLLVRLADREARSDTDLAHAIATALRWDVEVPDQSLKARIDNGWVTLEGTAEWNFQRRAAERAVRNLTGVRGVTNLIRVEPLLVPPDLRERIHAALRRRHRQDADTVSVETIGGTVILRGSVRSADERWTAEQVAWDAGAYQVDNLLRVDSTIAASA